MGGKWLLPAVNFQQKLGSIGSHWWHWGLLPSPLAMRAQLLTARCKRLITLKEAHQPLGGLLVSVTQSVTTAQSFN